MAKLINLLDHMKGNKVIVNGTVYHIDVNGIVDNMTDADAAKLLSGPHWVVYDPDAAVKREERRQALREEFKAQRGKLQLITKTGEVVDPKAEAKKKKSEPKAEPVAQPVVEEILEDFPSMKPEETPEEQSEEQPEETSAEAVEEKKAGMSEEWPDPHIGMKKAFLLDMADAYGLEVSKTKPNKKQLVDMIMSAMYDQP